MLEAQIKSSPVLPCDGNMEENADKQTGIKYSSQIVQTVRDGAQFVNMRRKNCFERLSDNVKGNAWDAKVLNKVKKLYERNHH